MTVFNRQETKRVFQFCGNQDAGLFFLKTQGAGEWEIPKVTDLTSSWNSPLFPTLQTLDMTALPKTTRQGDPFLVPVQYPARRPVKQPT